MEFALHAQLLEGPGDPSADGAEGGPQTGPSAAAGDAALPFSLPQLIDALLDADGMNILLRLVASDPKLQAAASSPPSVGAPL